MEQLPISPQGFELLQSELRRLKTEERPRIIKMIEFARSLGDLSENAEYETAKDRQAFNDKRISELETKLSSCMVIDPSKVQDKSKLPIGLSFEIEDLDSGDKKIDGIIALTMALKMAMSQAHTPSVYEDRGVFSK